MKEGGFVAEKLEIKIDEILSRYSAPEESLIAILQEVQDFGGYISKDAVEYITEKTGIPSSRIMGVASFTISITGLIWV